MGYLRRLTHYSHMDLESTLWQMVSLCHSPSRAYQATLWHHQTKNQWARDDPGFVALQSLFLAVSAVAWGVAFHSGVLGTLKMLLRSLLVDYLLLGLLVATSAWLFANRFLSGSLSNVVSVGGVGSSGGGSSSSGSGRVEWMYAWDVHCNGFCPAFLVLHVAQLALSPLVYSGRFYGVVASAVLHGAAWTWYFYVVFLGYHALHFLRNTVVFVYPVAILLLSLLVCVVLRVNLSVLLLSTYF